MAGRAGAELDTASESADRLEALLHAMDAAFLAGDLPRLGGLGAEAARLARRFGDARAECLAERGVAVAELRRGQAACALARLEAVLPVARRVGDPELIMTLLGTFGTSAEMIGDTERSDQARLEVERIARTTGDLVRLGGSIADRGSFLGLRGDDAAGRELIHQGVEILRPLGMTPSLRWSLLQLSIVESRLRHVGQARADLGEALPTTLEAEDPLMLTNIVGAVFELALAEGRVADAEALWPTLLSALRTHGIYWQRAGFLERLAGWLVAATGRGSIVERLEIEAAPSERADLVAAIRGLLPD